MKKIEIYSDGACRGNPGPGGWGALLRYDGHEKRLYGAEPQTTNNRMELKATIEALRALRQPCEVTVWTDSQYVKKGMTEWLPGWKAKGWKTAARAPVKNADLWQELEQASVALVQGQVDSLETFHNTLLKSLDSLKALDSSSH